MGWNWIQSNSSMSASGVAPVTYADNVQSGTTLIVPVAVYQSATTAVKDGAGNPFIKIASVPYNNSAVSGEVSLWALNTPAGDVGTTPTITPTFSGSIQYMSMLVQEVAGLAAGSTAAQLADGTPGTAYGSSTNTDIGPPSYASTAPDEYLVYVYGDIGDGITVTPSSPYMADPDNVNSSRDQDCCLAYANSAGGTESGTWTQSGGSGAKDWGLILVAFNLAAAAPVLSDITGARQLWAVTEARQLWAVTGARN
ncbi:MAG: hypothetical protein ACRDP5_06735 [Streptosporangiaceae bacterium]